MNRYALIKNGSVDLIVEQDDTPVLPGTWVEVTGMNVGPLDFYDGVSFTKYVPPPAQEIITKVAMISRFTPQEYVGIISATKTDIEVQAWYDLFQAANVVDLSDQRTIAGINSFVGKNLLTQARADAILTDPVQDSERP
jgi:hypothetical protein